MLQPGSVFYPPEIDNIPQRVVSLVPSYTESLFDLGLGSAVIAITDFCTQPATLLQGIPRVGGPKNALIDQIISLKPDLVLANREENTREIVEALSAAGVPVWAAFPQTVSDLIADLWQLARLFRSDFAAARLKPLEQSVEWATLAVQADALVPYFCPIWQDISPSGIPYWMTFNDQTYSSDLLKLCGGINLFSDRARRYPLDADLGQAPEEDSRERDTRYPCITRDEIIAVQPEVILLPDEPFTYTAEHIVQISEWFAETPAARSGRVYKVDGSLVTWCGTRLARALQELPDLFQTE
jgi:ABC-type hemin transport system substrate-binding protein